MNVIEVKNLSFSYSSKKILKNISFNIEKGDFVCVVGANGTGKSTLLKLILNILKASSGEIKLLGEDSTNFNSFNKISYISQKASSFNESFPATVKEVVSSGLYSITGFFKFPTKEQKNTVDKCIEIVGLKDKKNSLIGNLSGGQQQRVFIAKSLVNNPEIIFLDEPTVGIDTTTVESICCLLGNLNAQGITIFMVTHDISPVLYHANKVLNIIENDKIELISKDEFQKRFNQNLGH